MSEASAEGVSATDDMTGDLELLDQLSLSVQGRLQMREMYLRLKLESK